MKYRKKPLEVETRQLTIENAKELAAWCGGKCEYRIQKPHEFWYIQLDDDMQAICGEWIVKEIDGEFYLVQPDVFEKTYEKVEE